MKTFRIASTLLFLLCASRLPAQNPAAAKGSTPVASREPLAVDVHDSPYRAVVYSRVNFAHQRFDMRDATVLDLISIAYSRGDDGSILGGPPWISFNHFDVAAYIPAVEAPSPMPGSGNLASPPPNPYDPARPILRRALEERFHLKYHSEERPLPGFIMTVAKDGPKLTETKDPTASPECHSVPDKATPGQFTVTCTSETVANMIKMFGGVYPHPIIDRTGLTKSYDFTLKMGFTGLRTRDDYMRIYTDTFEKQLGLAIAPGNAPQPAMFIDSVDRPTPNPPDIAKLIPELPDIEFEVATIKPKADTEPQDQMRPLGSQITLTGYSLQGLLVEAFQLKTGAMLGNAPPWLSQTRYTLTLKLPTGMDARAVFMDEDQFDRMLQKLLIDRFQVKYHWGEQTQDGYVLLAGTPKMKKADPTSRSFCKYGPPEGEKDIRSGNSPYDNESHCQNVTMDQFAEAAQAVAGSEIKNRVVNKTGLPGSYDITLYYSSGRKLRSDAAAAEAAAKQAGEMTAAPAGGLSIVGAFRKELGLRLEKQPGTYPALILDHIEQTPTEN